MTSPALALPLTVQYREALGSIRASTVRSWLQLWPLLDPENPASFDAWLAAVLLVVDRDRAVASGVAADYLRSVRRVAGVPGSPPISTVPLQRERAVTSLAVTGLSAYRQARRAGQQPDQASRTALVRSTGTGTRLVTEAGREVVRASVAVDPRSQGWRRVTDGNACDFCRRLAGRGDVYKATTADFRSHDHCGCSAEPVYR